jgi:hypothetical protein
MADSYSRIPQHPIKKSNWITLPRVQIKINDDRPVCTPLPLEIAALYVDDWLSKNEDDPRYREVSQWLDQANAKLEPRRPTEKEQRAEDWGRKLVEAGRKLHWPMEELEDLFSTCRKLEFTAEEWREIVAVAMHELTRQPKAKKRAAKAPKA